MVAAKVRGLVGFGADLNSLNLPRSKTVRSHFLEGDRRTMPKLTVEQLLEAIEHLYEALRILKSVLKEIGSGAMRGIEISDGLATAWFQVNCCRLYTQSDVNFEELNVEAMGLINDAKCMIDSLMNWHKGMTPHAKLYITHSIRSAGANLNLVLTDLESCLSNKKRSMGVERLPAL